jgi:GTPase SAR1 family protein
MSKINKIEVNGDNNIVIQDVNGSHIYINSDEGVKQLYEDFKQEINEIKRLLENQQEPVLQQFAEKIYNIEKANTVIFNGQAKVDMKSVNQVHFHEVKPKPLTEKQKDRLEMLEGLRERYQERFSKKMEYENNLFIPFEPEYTKVGTSETYQDIILSHYEAEQRTDFDNLYKDFIETHKSLLIIGEPGAGKTVLLLQIAQKLLENAYQDENYPYPIILNLATWRNEGQKFETWLGQNLVFSAGRSGISKQFAKELIDYKQRNIITLLDGLDEIPEDDRKSCILAIGKYFKGQENNNPHNYPIGVICCRKEEYLQLKANLPTQAITEITRLKLSKVIIELEKKNIKASKILLDIIQKYRPDIEFTQKLTTIFEVHLALNLAESYLFYNFSIEKLTRGNLVDAYISQEIQKIESYPPEKTQHYLSFLAQKLQERRKGITFELLDLQPNWLKNRFNYNFTIYFVYFVTPFIVISFFAFLFGFYMPALRLLISGLLFAFIVGILYKIMRDEMEITPKEKIILNLGSLSKLSFRRVGLYIFVFIFVFTIVFFLQGDYGVGIFLILVFLIDKGSEKFFLVVNGNRYIKISNPYKRLYAPFVFEFLKFFIFPIPIFILISISILMSKPFTFKLFLVIGFFSFLILVFAFFASLLNFPLSKHFILRLLLWREGKMPLRFVTFLNFVSTKTGLMEKDGGQWRFRHQLIEDRLHYKIVGSPPDIMLNIMSK